MNIPIMLMGVTGFRSHSKDITITAILLAALDTAYERVVS